MLQNILDNTGFVRSLLLVSVLLLGSCFLVKKMLVTVLPYYFVRFLLTPGICIHELSHAAGCFLTGAKVESITVFDKDGGSVKHGEPYIKVIGPPVISMAPVFGSLLLFYFWSLLLNTPFQNVGTSSDFLSNASSFFNQLGQVDWLNWPIWLYLYGCLNLVIGVGPSQQDFVNCKWELPLLFVVLGVIEYFGFISGAKWASLTYRFTVPLILMSLFFLILLLPVYLIRKKS